jgi:hypothetical protein
VGSSVFGLGLGSVGEDGASADRGRDGNGSVITGDVMIKMGEWPKYKSGGQGYLFRQERPRSNCSFRSRGVSKGVARSLVCKQVLLPVPTQLGRMRR